MTQRPKPRRVVFCPDCNAEVAVFYRDGQRITADYRMPGKLVTPSDATTIHRKWFRGIDVAQELADCTGSLWDAECNCRKNELHLRALLDQVTAAPKPRVPLRVG